MSIAKILKVLDYYDKFKPYNYNIEKQRFFFEMEKGHDYNPLFIYEDKLRASDYIRMSRLIDREFGDDKIINEYLMVYRKVAELMIAWKNDEYDLVTNISGELFGDYRNLNVSEILNIYSRAKEQNKLSGNIYNEKQIVEHFNNELERHNISDWEVEAGLDFDNEFMINGKEKKILVQKDHEIDKLYMNRVISHEIVGHLFQKMNGEYSKKYRRLFTSHLGLETQYEGLALFTEIHNLPSSYFNFILEKYLLLMYATFVACQSSFRGTYDEIYKLSQDKDFAFFATFRAKKGFRDTKQAGSFQRDNSYIFGVRKIIDLVNDDEHNYRKLISGIFPFSVIPFVEAKKDKQQKIGIKMFNKVNEGIFLSTIWGIFT